MGVVGLGSSVVLARIYGVNVIGEYALVLSVVLFTMLLSTVREQTALVRDLSVLGRHDPRVTGRFYAVLAFSLGLTLVVGGIAFVVSAAIFRGPLDQPDLVLATGVALLGHLLFEKVAWNLDMVLTAFRGAQELFWLRLLQALSLVAVAIGLGLAGYDSLMSLVIATVASWGVALVARLIVARSFISFLIPFAEVRAGFAKLPEYLRFGIKAIGVSIGSIGRLAPTWVLAGVGSIATVGAYSRAEMITTRVTEGIWRVTEMLLPTLVERREEGNLEGFDRSLVDTLRYMVVALLALAAAVGGAAVGVMQVFGPGFDAAANALVLLMLAPALNAVGSGQEQALYAVNRPLALSAIELSKLVFGIGVTVALGIAFGATGVAAAVVLTAALAAVLYGKLLGPYMQSRFTRYWSFREMAVIGISYGAGFATARVTDSMLGGHGATLLALIVGAAVYCMVFLLLGGLNARDRERISRSVVPKLGRFRPGGVRVAG